MTTDAVTGLPRAQRGFRRTECSIKVLLAVPPVGDASAPPLGVASLAAFLKAHGCDATYALDLNTLLLEFLVRSPFLEEQAAKVMARFSVLDAREPLSREEQAEYRALVGLYLFCVSGEHLKGPSYLSELTDRATLDRLDRYRDVLSPFFVHLLHLASYAQRTLYRPLLSAEVSAEPAADDPLVSRFYEEAVLPRILELAPDVIGLSVCYADQFAHAAVLARAVKRLLPETFVVVGGTYATSVAEELLQGVAYKWPAPVDVVVKGEGELPLLRLIQALSNGSGLERVPNLVYWTEAGPRETARQPPLALEDLPLPDFSVLPLGSYASPQLVLPYRIGRGCYWSRCSFCSHYQTRRVSHRPPGVVLGHLRRLQERYGTPFYYFTDDSLPASFLAPFVQAVSDSRLDLQWAANVRCEPYLAQGFVPALARAGCRVLYLGVETASQRLLALVRKGISAEDAGAIMDACHEHSIAVKLNLIQGLPTEDEADIQATAAFVRRHARRADLLALSTFRVFRDTEVARAPRDFGLELSQDANGRPVWYNATTIPATRTSGVPTLEIALHQYASRLRGVRIHSEFLTRMHHLLFASRFTEAEFRQDRAAQEMRESCSGSHRGGRGRMKPNVRVRLRPDHFAVCVSRQPTDGPAPGQGGVRCYLIERPSLRVCKSLGAGWHEVLGMCTGAMSPAEIAATLRERCPAEERASFGNAVVAGLEILYQDGILLEEELLSRQQPLGPGAPREV